MWDKACVQLTLFTVESGKEAPNTANTTTQQHGRKFQLSQPLNNGDLYLRSKSLR